MDASFADVRDFAVNGEGPCCTDGERLEALMREVLWTLWSEIPPKDRKISSSFDTVVDQSDYAVSGGTTRISNLSSGSCQLVRREPACNPCHPEAGTGGRGKPSSWSIAHDGKVHLEPTPDGVYTIYYDNVLDLEDRLFTTAGDVRTWDLLPFPEAYHSVYMTMVRGKAVLESDPARGVMLYNSALNNFRAIVADRLRDFEGARKLVINRDAGRRRYTDPDSAFRWKLPDDYVFVE